MFLFLKVIFTTIEFAANLLLCLSLFRISFRYSLHKVLFIALIMAVISVYMRDVVNLFAYSLVPLLVTEIVLITLFFGLPLIFSFLICVIGVLATITFETLVIFVGSFFDLFSEQMVKTSLSQFIIVEIINAAVVLLVMYPIQKYKLGFHTTSNDALKAYNFWLSGILIVAIIIMQIGLVIYTQSTFHIVFPIILGAILLSGVYLAYEHNKKLWKNRRERLSKR